MGTFGGLSIASSGLTAARKALEVTGQNVANANTTGYTRQRVDQSPLAQTALATHATQSSVGDGVRVTGVSRVTDTVVTARVNSTASSAAYWNASSSALSSVETSLNEPGANGLSQVMNDFWAKWQTVANNTGTTAAGQGAANALIAQGQLVGSTVSAGYTAASNAWADARAGAASVVSTINDTAARIANLNTTIRALSAAGSDVNSLLDQRDAAVTSLANLAGASTRSNADGTIDVLVGGNALVSGVTTRTVVLGGAGSFSTVASSPVKLTWADTGGGVSLDGGDIAGRIQSLQPADTTGGGAGGVFAEAAKAFDDIARSVADAVNTVHRTGTTATGATGLDFFSYSSTGSPALTLSVVPSTVSGVAVADGTKGNLDNTIADRIAQIGSTAGSPDSAWATYVSRLGSQTATATARSTTATTAAAAATTAQTSVGGVDLDEETANLVIYQHAYQASARVISTINDVLDTLIRMGT
ncbi:flagellar hook-associated protein FlgK [uncultured Amnibacterium sp.]|uniref:flagellar hook-associated protein FlgK n=1 Tax=uncultured Amnibacterium sp. TaxID=1631851 RepID=UPI0035CA2DE7